mgnify:CR=1 FL=1
MKTPLEFENNNNQIINCSTGEPHFPIDDEILKAIKENTINSKCNYSSSYGILELREKIIAIYNSKYKLNLDTNNVLIGFGVSNLLSLLFNVLAKHGERVLLFEPYYFSYLYILEHANINVTFINENFTKDDLDKIKLKINYILFSDPCNPSGKIINSERIKMLIDFADKNDAYIISDEIYADFIYSKTVVKNISIISQYDKAIILRGFSKSYSMTGLRIGYLITSKKDLISKLAEYQMHALISVPENIQNGCIKALDTDLERKFIYYKNNSILVYETLKDYFYIPQIEGGFYAFLRLPTDSTKFCKELLNYSNIALADGKLFCHKKNYARLAFCNSKENLIKALDGIKLFMENNVWMTF